MRDVRVDHHKLGYRMSGVFSGLGSLEGVEEGIERVVAVARLVLAAALSLALLLGLSRASAFFPFLAFAFVVYLLYAVVVLLWQRGWASWYLRLALLAGDVAMLIVVVLFAPNLPAAFLVFFLYFAVVAGLWEGWKAAAGLSLLVGIGYLGVVDRKGLVGVEEVLFYGRGADAWGVAGVLLVAGTLVGALAEREQRRLARAGLVEKFNRLLSLDARWADLWERFLGALCEQYQAQRALVAYCDPDNDRVYVWQFQRGKTERALVEMDRPPRDAPSFLLHSKLPVCRRGRVLKAGTWRWESATWGEPLQATPSFSLPVPFVQEFSPLSLLTVPLFQREVCLGRLFLLDGKPSGFDDEPFGELCGLLRGLAPALTTLLTVRGLLAQAVDNERERVVRELHDSVAQTLASVEMQLGVFCRMTTQESAPLGQELTRLYETVQGERAAFRRFLRALQPVRVPPSELLQRLVAHCAQFQQETGIVVAVSSDRLPENLAEGISREVFLLLREALHNIRKHADAKRVGVQIRQEADRLFLQVDDDGNGFSFAGTHTDVALRESGLAPTALSERVRGLGGELAIDSTLGSGATVRIEIPLP